MLIGIAREMIGAGVLLISFWQKKNGTFNSRIGQILMSLATTVFQYIASTLLLLSQKDWGKWMHPTHCFSSSLSRRAVRPGRQSDRSNRCLSLVQTTADTGMNGMVKSSVEPLTPLPVAAIVGLL